MAANTVQITSTPKSASSKSLAIALLGICVFISMEFVFAGTGGTTLSEAAVYVTAAWLFCTSKLYYRPAVLVIGLGGIFVILPTLAYGWDRAYAPYLKTFVNFGLGLLVFDNLMADKEFRTKALRWVAVIGLVLSCYGILQALFGFGTLPDIYTLGGVPISNNSQSQNLGGEVYSLVGVMRWKAGLFNAAIGTKLVAGLSYGLHWFSNNFAEYLVFASIAAWVSLASSKKMLRLLASQVVFMVAIVASGGRTSLLGFLLVASIFLYLLAPRKYRPLMWIAGVLAVAFLLTLDLSLFLFDEGGTVGGRSELNFLAFGYIEESIYSLMFGGRAADFAARAYSNVHSTFLYYWLYGGLLTVVLMFGLFSAWLFSAVSGYYLAKDHEDKVVFAGATTALIWFLVYGATWAAVALPNTLFFVCLFVGCLRGARRDARTKAASIP